MDFDNKNIRDNHFFDLYGKRDSRLKRLFYIFGFFGFIFLVFYFIFIATPVNFLKGEKSFIFKIEKGETLNAVALRLDKEKIIKSPLAFRVLVSFFPGDAKVKAEAYLFDKRQNLFFVLYRLVEGKRGFESLEFVFPEGTSVKEMAEILKQKISDFKSEEFVKKALAFEGKLFPDTYLFLYDVSPDDVIKTLNNNFLLKIKPLESDIKKTKRTLDQIINMASIVEEEGKDYLSKQMIAGILWKRLDIKMPLQVDAVFRYWNGKHSFTLTTEDLKEDSPYNTYTRIGLPPTPITNPGLDSIKAVIYPKKSNYLYYLTGKDGKMYYASTHDEHVLNKEKYLR